MTIERSPSVSRNSCSESRCSGKRGFHLGAAVADFLDGHGLEHHDLAVEFAEDFDAFGVAFVVAAARHRGGTISC